MRKGSDSELVSNFARAQFQDLKFKPGIAAGRDGQPLASLEMVTVINLANVDNPNGVNVTVRGLQPAGIEMRRGRTARERPLVPDRAQRELVVGHSVAERFPDAQLGQDDPLRPRRVGRRRRHGLPAGARRTARSGAT